jgi:hypothetical protein
MIIQDKDIDPLGEVGKKRFEFQKELTPISQAGVAFARYFPGVAFEITRSHGMDANGQCRGARGCSHLGRLDARRSGSLRAIGVGAAHRRVPRGAGSHAVRAAAHQRSTCTSRQTPEQ